MRTCFRLTFAVMLFAFTFSSYQAHALVIWGNYAVTSDSAFTEDVTIVTGGTLTINSGMGLLFPSGYSLTVTSGGTLNVMANSTIHMNTGGFFVTSGGTVQFNTNAALRIAYAGQIHLMGGSFSCNNSRIEGAAPTYATTLHIDARNVLNGTCTISNVYVAINSTSWDISSTSHFVFESYATFSDPTCAGSHTIESMGSLTLTNGQFYFNTSSATRIDLIHLRIYSSLSISNSNVHAIPNIFGDYPSSVSSANSVLTFEDEKWIETEGDITMEYTNMSEYSTGMGWNGLYMHNGPGNIHLSHCRIKDINTNTTSAAIKIDNPTGGSLHLDYCTIYSPTNTYAGAAIEFEGTNIFDIDCSITCTYIQDFEIGVYAGPHTTLDMSGAEITGNVTGCYLYSCRHSHFDGCGIHANTGYGVQYFGALDNHIHQCDIYNNGSGEIYADVDAAGYITTLEGVENNIYNASVLYLVYVAGNSYVELPSCWWALYPPVLGTNLYCAGGSTLIFNPYHMNPVGPGYYLSCGIITPKITSENGNAAHPLTPAIAMSNYPNPFNPSTTIEYTLPEEMSILLHVYSLSGQYVTTLAEGMHSAGTHTAAFNAPSNLPSGMYIYTLYTPFGPSSGRMLLTK